MHICTFYYTGRRRVAVSLSSLGVWKVLPKCTCRSEHAALSLLFPPILVHLLVLYCRSCTVHGKGRDGHLLLGACVEMQLWDVVREGRTSSGTLRDKGNHRRWGLGITDTSWVCGSSEGGGGANPVTEPHCFFNSFWESFASQRSVGSPTRRPAHHPPTPCLPRLVGERGDWLAGRKAQPEHQRETAAEVESGGGLFGLGPCGDMRDDAMTTRQGAGQAFGQASLAS